MKLGIPYNVGNLSIRRDSCLLKKDSDPRSEQVRNCEYPVHKAGSKLVPNAHHVINSYITGSTLQLTSSPYSLYSWNCALIPDRPSSTVRWYNNLLGMSCEHLWHSLTRLLVYHLHFHIPCALYFDYTSTLILDGERTSYISMHYFQTTERCRPDDRRDIQIKIY